MSNEETKRALCLVRAFADSARLPETATVERWRAEHAWREWERKHCYELLVEVAVVRGVEQ